MYILMILGLVLASYLVGSIPFGLLIVRLSTGKDIRSVESGRTGGTNAMRAAGIWAGLVTAFLDLMKSAVTVWLAQLLAPGSTWLQVLAPVAAVLGHNYSIFLMERNADGTLKLRGGAGGAPTVGGALGLWPASFLILVPLGALILYGLGYASVATMSVGLLAALIFAVRAMQGISPWQYVFYGLITEVFLILALMPNIRRLIQGNERLVGWRARRKKTV
ncbi:MAG TPA: glycerol-3-phosphate acyltransferase [Anaerolineales bacterium]